ncbi:MAG: hypothetical protein Q9179_003780 [Wetmoreana sp. 5 TL-2023]
MSKAAEMVRQEETDEEGDAPDIVFNLEEDLNRKDQLFSFRKEPVTPTKDYHAREQQLLQEGKLGNSEFSARLRKVIFGIFDDQPACLIVFRVDFATVKKGWFRFRNATIEAEFEETTNDNAGTVNDDDDDDDDDNDEYNGPIIRKFYPELIRGHISSAAHTYGLGFEVPLSPAGGAAISARYDITAPRQGLHLIQGRLMGSPETRIKWIMNENEVSKGGGLPVTGRGGSRILFTPSKARQQLGKHIAKSTARLTGGSFEVGKKQWISSQETPNAPVDLSVVDLENLTQMRSVLLSDQGPGAGQSVSSNVNDLLIGIKEGF